MSNFVDNSNATALMGAVEASIANTRTFKGTLDQWDALTAEEKAKYSFIATPDGVIEDVSNVVTDGDMRPVTSNAVYGEIQDVNNEFSAIENVYGAKNLIPYPYPKMSTTVRGITWSDNGDGGIVGNGMGTEASLQPYCELNGNQTANVKNLLLKANTWYALTCKRTSPYAIGANVYFLDPSTMLQTSITYDVIYGDNQQTTNTRSNVYMYEGGIVYEEVKFKLPQDMYAQTQVRYKAGTNVSVANDVQYPMLRFASIQDDTWVPYAKTNKQLTDNLKVKTIELTNQASTSDGKLILTGMGHKMAIVSTRLLNDSNNRLIVPFGFCYSSNGDALFMLADNSDNTIITSSITLSGTMEYIDLS